MFQSFTTSADPSQGPARLAALRAELARAGLAGFMIPRADAHQGEYVAPRDERLAWLTGFSGSAGFCIALADRAGVFIDGRYRAQVKDQVDLSAFTPVPWPEVLPADWLKDALPEGGVVGFDPWLYTPEQIEALEAGLMGSGITLRAGENLVDRIWPDQPAPPVGAVSVQPDALTGESHAAKRARLADELRGAGQTAAVLSLPDALAWLLNIRGSDIPRNPVPHGFAILHDTGHVTLFMEGAKLDAAARAHLGPEVTLRPPEALLPALRSLPAPVRLHKGSIPMAIAQELTEAGVETQAGTDPCALPKACKSAAELAGIRAAHLRDGAAMVRFLRWFDEQAPGTITEIDVVRRLEAERAANGDLQDISFDTIAGSGSHGAVIHYRVTTETNRSLQNGELLVLDSGGQYVDGTTDITRTLPVGCVGEDERAAFTRVLQGMIALSRVRFPKGVTGAHLDSLARYPLWLADQDYGHGTGHGVGAYLCVHEGPQSLSRRSDVVLREGMILSNEPGYYREGAFGIRIENLVAVTAVAPMAGGDGATALAFETLTYVPIDRRLIAREMLSAGEIAWLDAYHAACRDKIAPFVSGLDALWLARATEPL